MDKLTQIERIKLKLKLAKYTDTFLEVFGADCHKYDLDSPMKTEKVEEFENKYEIKLPNEYKAFLTEIGTGFGNLYDENGKIVIEKTGAGPEIGIKKLEIDFEYYTPAYLKEKVIFNSRISQSEWEKITDEIYEENINNETFEISYSGILCIGERGCSGIIGIILNGEDKGKIIYGSREEEFLPKLMIEKKFLDWYENWLDKIISGESIENGYNSFSEEELISRYEKSQKEHWKIVSLSYIRFQKSISNKLLDLLHNKYREEKNTTVKLYLINILAKFDYDNIIEELKNLSRQKTLEFLRLLHLYKPEKTGEWIEEIINFYNNKSKSTQVKEYIRYTSLNDNEKLKTLIIKKREYEI